MAQKWEQLKCSSTDGYKKVVDPFNGILFASKKATTWTKFENMPSERKNETPETTYRRFHYVNSIETT